MRLPPGAISRSLPESAGASFEEMSQYSARGWLAVSPPGCPSSEERLWPPCRWTVSSPAFAGSECTNETSVRSPAGRRIVGPGKLPP